MSPQFPGHERGGSALNLLDGQSAPHEGKEQGEIAAVSRPEGREVTRASVGRANEITPAPRESRLSLGVQEHVSHQPRPAAIAVRPRMDEYELVVEARGELVDGVDLVGKPERRVVEALAEREAHLRRGDAHVFPGPSIRTRPRPRLVEHTAMQLHREVGGEDGRCWSPSARHRPCIGSRNVQLLPRIELTLRGDVRGQKPLGLIRVERCGVRKALRPGGSVHVAYFGRLRWVLAGFVAEITAFASHRRRGVSANAAVRSAICACMSAGFTA